MTVYSETSVFPFQALPEKIICINRMIRLHFIIEAIIIKEEDDMERYGYIRVSTKEQNPERQFLAMEEQKIKTVFES